MWDLESHDVNQAFEGLFGDELADCLVIVIEQLIEAGLDRLVIDHHGLVEEKLEPLGDVQFDLRVVLDHLLYEHI
jgi:hypothetical protein